MTNRKFDVDDFWLSTTRGSVGASWYWPTAPVDPSTCGVVLVPGLTHEEQTMAVGLVDLARQLASAGLPTLLIDLAGTAQGAGHLDADDIALRWDDDVRTAVHHVRDAGLRHVAVVGVRLGALLAARALVDDPVDLMVMWSPVLSGRRYVRELQVMQGAASDAVSALHPGLTVAGFNLAPHLLEHLKGMDAGKLDGKPASRLILVDTDDRLAAVPADHPLVAAVPTTRMMAPETEDWLYTAADVCPAPFGDTPRVVDASVADANSHRGLSTVDDGLVSRPEVDSFRTQVVTHDGARIRETFVRFGAETFPGGGSLSGILAEPEGGVVSGPAMLCVTTVGPGRIMVDLGRREAAAGRASLRFNFSGFGSSSRRPRESWADFYHPSAPAEVGAAVDFLRSVGHERVVVTGFCAGAWAALRMAPRPEVAGIVAINIQLMIRSRLPHRRSWPDMRASQQVQARVAREHQVVRVIEKLEHVFPLPSAPMRWIGRHQSSGTPVTLVYDDADLGLDYYRARERRPFGVRRRSRRPDVRAYADLGHLPAGRARDRMLADLHELTARPA